MSTENFRRNDWCKGGGKACGIHGEHCHFAAAIKKESHRGGLTSEDPKHGIGTVWRRDVWNHFTENVLAQSDYCLRGRKYLKRVAAAVTTWKVRNNEFV